jgi:hypothetical protein
LISTFTAAGGVDGGFSGLVCANAAPPAAVKVEINKMDRLSRIACPPVLFL